MRRSGEERGSRRSDEPRTKTGGFFPVRGPLGAHVASHATKQSEVRQMLEAQLLKIGLMQRGI